MNDTSGKKKALAAAGFALGLAGSGSVAGDTMKRQQTQPQDGLQALVFVSDYQPSVGFQVVSRIQQPTVNQILGYVNPADPNQGDGAVVDPTDWNGYITNYQGCGPGNYNLVFLREGTLQQGQTYSFTTDAIFFSNRLQLLESEIQRGAGAAAGQETEGAGQTQTETTPEETTTEGTTTTTEGTTTTTEGTTTTTEGTTTTTEGTTTTTEGTTTTTEGTTTTPPDTTTETPTTTEQVIVNATETEDGG
ncbi:hypothetical protein [Halorussus aquaticus]|uniref:DUF4430 domain-containing protein n=1 Tax=Halorussus aquaticus TaxID=2953748 RepID=A0ABD5Q3P9_9EURY|nr:hypothetical protein [Halorussus aquaticus]